MRALRGWPGRTKRCATYRTDTETGARLLGQVDALDDAGEVPFPLAAELVSIMRDIVRWSSSGAAYVENPLVQAAGRDRHKMPHSDELEACLLLAVSSEDEDESEAQFGFRKDPPALSLQARVLLFQKRLMTPAARYGAGERLSSRVFGNKLPPHSPRSWCLVLGKTGCWNRHLSLGRSPI